MKPNFVPAVPSARGPASTSSSSGGCPARRGSRRWSRSGGTRGRRIVVAGEGPDRAPATQRAVFVDYRGNLGGHELPPLLAGARALLVPSRWYEGAPRVVLEAYAAGVPVLASQIGALP